MPESGERKRNLTTLVLVKNAFFFLLYACLGKNPGRSALQSATQRWVSKVARTGHNLHLQRRIKQQNCGSNKFLHRGDGKMKRMLEPSIKLIGEVHRMSG